MKWVKIDYRETQIHGDDGDDLTTVVNRDK